MQHATVNVGHDNWASPAKPKDLGNTLMSVLTVCLVVMLLAAVPQDAHAQFSSSALPWETFTQKVACALQGPWVKWAAVIAVALGGVMFGLGELSGPFQRVMQIAGGFSIALGAVGVVAWLLPAGSMGTTVLRC